MSKLNIASNLMLGKAELNRFQKFVFDDGFIKSLLNGTVRFGIVYNTVDSSQTNYFDSFKVEQGTNGGTIKINPGIAVDSSGRFITINKVIDNISIPDDGNYYWIKIAHKYTNEEVGTVSVDANGNLLGNGTEFLKVLRGQPNFPTRIKFLNSTLNIQEYDILSITSDTVALLNVSTINAESNLKYEIVGTFTPGQVPLASDKMPFNYDSCIPFTANNGIVEENTFNVRPNYTQNIEFYIARVKNNSGVMEIQDKRDDIWEPKADFEIRQLLYTTNNCFGLEGVQYDTLMGTNSRNIAVVGWGVRSTNWTLNHSSRIVSLLSCKGGKYKSTADFANGSFDYWRVYTASGKQVKVLNSIKNGTQIDLYVDKLDPDDFPNGMITVVPDAEEIELKFKTVRLNAGTGSPVVPNSKSSQDDINVCFPIGDSFAKVPLAIWDYNNPDQDYMQSGYTLTFKYKSFKTYSQEFIDSTSYNYYSEEAYNNQGDLIDDTKYRTTVSGGSFTIFHNPQAYHFFKSAVYLGDKYCVRHLQLSDENPIIDLKVGISCQYQLFEGVDNIGVSQYINLNTLNAVAGNKFILNFQIDFANSDPDNNKFGIVQDYVNSGNVGTLLYQFSTFDIIKSREKNLLFNCEFDGTNWILFKMVSQEEQAVDTQYKVVYMDKEHFDRIPKRTHRKIIHNKGLTAYHVNGYVVFNPPIADNAIPYGTYWLVLNQDANSFTVYFAHWSDGDDNLPADFCYSLISVV